MAVLAKSTGIVRTWSMPMKRSYVLTSAAMQHCCFYESHGQHCLARGACDPWMVLCVGRRSMEGARAVPEQGPSTRRETGLSTDTGECQQCRHVVGTSAEWSRPYRLADVLRG